MGLPWWPHCAQSLNGSSPWEAWLSHEYDGGSMMVGSGVISQLCFLQHKIWVVHFHGHHISQMNYLHQSQLLVVGEPKLRWEKCLRINHLWRKQSQRPSFEYVDPAIPDVSERTLWMLLLNTSLWASLVVQWLRVCLPVQGTWVWALVWEDPTCRRAARPVSHEYWACASGACTPQWERPRQWEARAPRWRVVPACRN